MGEPRKACDPEDFASVNVDPEEVQRHKYVPSCDFGREASRSG